MNRVRPDQVIDAYLATGMYPEQSTFYDKQEIYDDNDKVINVTHVACGIGVLYAARHGVGSVPPGRGWDDAYQSLELEEQYMRGFVDGFDEAYTKEQLNDLKPELDDHKNAWLYFWGREDGAACFTAANARFTAPE